MLLKQLKLINFRNYLEFNQDFNYLKTIVIGQNAQGKSNILEAINILAKGTSDRAFKDNDLIYWNKEYALIYASIESEDPEPHLLEIALQINPTGRRKLKINGVSKKAPQADLIGNFFTVMFSADDLYLIKGSPSHRRKWIDSNLTQLDSKYHKELQTYQKAVIQKNALLKNAHERSLSKKALRDQLEIWNEQIINAGTELLSKRIKYLQEINLIAKDFLQEISRNEESLSLVYESTVVKDGSTNIKALFKKAIDESFEDEFIRSQSLVGPHRDDLIFLINKRGAKSFASQGQQRSIILSLKLSELKVIEKRTNEIPVLLLDDVLAELDIIRQDFLLHHLPDNIQTFITTTHINDIQKELLKHANVLKIEKGEISHAKTST